MVPDVKMRPTWASIHVQFPPWRLMSLPRLAECVDFGPRGGLVRVAAFVGALLALTVKRVLSPLGAS